MSDAQKTEKPFEFARLLHLARAPNTTIAADAAYQLARSVVENLHLLDDHAVEGFIAFVHHMRKDRSPISHWLADQPPFHKIT